MKKIIGKNTNKSERKKSFSIKDVIVTDNQIIANEFNNFFVSIGKKLAKSGDSSQITNYRPISILSFFSKIFERIVYNYILDFMDSNCSIYKYQFGFRLHPTGYHHPS